MAWVFKKTLLKGEPPLLIMELPPYKRPLLRVVVRHMWDRSKVFLRQAGTVILGINIVLWFLATYPRNRRDRKGVSKPAAPRSAQPAPDSRGPGTAKAKEPLGDLHAEQEGARFARQFRRPPRPRDRTRHRAAGIRLENGHWHRFLLRRPGSFCQHHVHGLQRGLLRANPIPE